MHGAIEPGESISAAVIRAVADETNRDPLALAPLGDSVDPDAIDSLAPRSSGDGVETVTLRYEGCRVTIDHAAVTVETLP